MFPLVFDFFIDCVDDGVDPWEEDYDEEEAMADEAKFLQEFRLWRPLYVRKLLRIHLTTPSQAMKPCCEQVLPYNKNTRDRQQRTNWAFVVLYPVGARGRFHVILAHALNISLTSNKFPLSSNDLSPCTRTLY